MQSEIFESTATPANVPAHTEVGVVTVSELFPAGGASPICRLRISASLTTPKRPYTCSASVLSVASFRLRITCPPPSNTPEKGYPPVTSIELTFEAGDMAALPMGTQFSTPDMSMSCVRSICMPAGIAPALTSVANCMSSSFDEMVIRESAAMVKNTGFMMTLSLRS